MKSLIRKAVDFFFYRILPVFFSFYERHLMYRIHMAWGAASLRAVRNKGTNVKALGYARILSPDKLRLGDHVRIGTGCYFLCRGGLTIGKNSQLSRNITIYTANHQVKGTAIPYDDTYVEKPVTIGASVWIGMGVQILPGVTIGDGAIIGMGTVVSKDVPAGAVVVGAAQRIVNQRDMNTFHEADQQGRWFGKLYPHN